MPRISIVLPTYNRSDTILRALLSVRAQTFSDWELLLVDDGSTDDTQERIAGFDSRMRVLRQENQGVTAARNAALREASGELIAFLDSDDEWLPHHLMVAAAFFDANPSAQVLTSEFWEDFGGGFVVKHYRPETAEFAPRIAARIGSAAFRAPPPQRDPYLWFYSSRSPIGDWARAALAGTPFAGSLQYQGRIFDGWRWEFLMSMQSTVITRRALETVGPCDAALPVASDYAWLASLCREFPVTMLALPGTLKHEYAEGRSSLKEGHLATGPGSTRFHLDMLRAFERLFWSRAPEDPELSGIRAYRQYSVGLSALLRGQRELALEYLELSRGRYPGLDARMTRWFAKAVADPALLKWLVSTGRDLSTLPRRSVRRLGRLFRLEQAVA